jgi:Crp-like helix-turn-helix domain
MTISPTSVFGTPGVASRISSLSSTSEFAAGFRPSAARLPLSQGQIGQALGLTYVHVCRTLQILREQKIVSLANHRLEIIDPEALRATAGIEHEVPERQQVGRPAPTQSVSVLPEAADSLPPGWMPMQNDRPVSPGLASASGGHAFSPAKAA